jgi:hypothetical protein
MKRIFLSTVAVLALGATLAWAANNFPIATSGGNRTTFKSTDNAGVHTPHVNVDTVTSVTGATMLPTNGALTVDSKTVTNASGAFLAAAAATKYLFIKNESATASIALNYANGTAVLNTAGNITLGPGQWQSFEGSLVPTGAITAISSAATSPATVLRN